MVATIRSGIKKVIKRQVLFVGLTENFGAFDNTPDIGLHVGLSRSFGKRRSDVVSTEAEEG